MNRLLLSTALLAPLFLGSITAAQAVPVECTIAFGKNQSVTYSSTNATAVPGDPAGACLAGAADGNINGQTQGNVNAKDAFLLSSQGTGYSWLGELSQNGSKTGTWTISSALDKAYDGFVLGLKSGNSWATILLADGALSGTWTTSKNISHLALYGKPDDSKPVPGPIAGAGLPALMALGGFIWARRRKAAGAALPA